MCEIAALPVHEQFVNSIVTVADRLYTENSHGLGAAAVYTDGDQFTYETFAKTDPVAGDFRSFVMDNLDAWRLVIHARLATVGEHSDQNTHPLSMCDCEKCSIDYVVHNGGVTNYRNTKSFHERDGHDYSTGVDSEAIGHEVGTIPDSLDDFEEPMVRGRLNYLLFADDGILIRTDGKYEITDEFQIVCRHKDWNVGDGAKRRNGYTLIEPTTEVSSRPYKDVRSSSRVSYTSKSGKLGGKQATYNFPPASRMSGSSGNGDSGTSATAGTDSDQGRSQNQTGATQQTTKSKNGAAAAKPGSANKPGDAVSKCEYWHCNAGSEVAYCSRHFRFFSLDTDTVQGCEMCQNYGHPDAMTHL